VVGRHLDVRCRQCCRSGACLSLSGHCCHCQPLSASSLKHLKALALTGHHWRPVSSRCSIQPSHHHSVSSMLHFSTFCHGVMGCYGRSSTPPRKMDRNIIFWHFFGFAIFRGLDFCINASSFKIPRNIENSISKGSIAMFHHYSFAHTPLPPSQKPGHTTLAHNFVKY